MTESQIKLTLNIDATRFARSMERAAKAFHAFTPALMRPKERRRHKRRCAICSPFANPKPLAINGAEYRRRRNGR